MTVGQLTNCEAMEEASLHPIMALTDSISRLTSYYKRHGFTATLQRAKLFFRNFFSSNRLVIYAYDLSKSDSISSPRNWPDQLSFVRVASQEQIDQQDWQKILNFWDPKLTHRNFSTRFNEGASVWLVRSEGKLAGFGWTLTGRAIKPHFVPFGPNDVHLFDFLVFPEFRGQGINPQLVTYILDQLAAESRTRAYIEAAVSNHNQLKSLSKTGFHVLGIARKASFFGRTFVEWKKYQGKSSAEIAKEFSKN
jgi:ribosomal protein S18 acetylase RimI-like enzyme